MLPFLSVLVFSSCQKEEESIKPKMKDLTESIYASVVVQPYDLYEASANAQGLISNLLIEEGDDVTQGQVLAEITSVKADVGLNNAQLNLELAKEKLKGNASALKDLELQKQAIEKEVKVDSANYFRQKALWNKNIGSKAELEQRELKYDLSQKKLASIAQQYRVLQDELSTRVKEAENTVKGAWSTVGDFKIVSKIDGKVYQLFKEEGELILPQQSLATVGAKDSFLLDMQIDEVDIVRVEAGQKILVVLDAYGKEVFEGRVSKIFPNKDTRTQTFKVEGIFVQPPDKLFPGLSGEVNIVVAEKKNVMTIPLAYVFEDNKVRTNSGDIELVLGSKNLEEVEVISGIDANTELLKP